MNYRWTVELCNGDLVRCMMDCATNKGNKRLPGLSLWCHEILAKKLKFLPRPSLHAYSQL
jgi:hypothetical protein